MRGIAESNSPASSSSNLQWGNPPNPTMARRSSLLRHLFALKLDILFSPNTPSLSALKTLNPQMSLPLPAPFFSTSVSRLSSDNFFLKLQNFCSSASTPGIVPVKSDEEFNRLSNKIKDDGLPAIFYFTAAWCGPCRVIAPSIEELSKKHNVTTYKIDVDEAGLTGTLSKLQITSVPTLYFYQNGKKATEMVGADPARLRSTMENLYE